MTKIDDDATLTQLATAWVNVQLVRSFCDRFLKFLGSNQNSRCILYLSGAW